MVKNTKTTSAYFASLMRHHRTRLGFSLDKFAELSKTTATTISKAERGLRSPPDKSVPKWALALGLTGVDRAEFLRAARRAKAYANTSARPELDSLTDEVDILILALQTVGALVDRTELTRAFDRRNPAAAGLLDKVLAGVRTTMGKGDS